MKSFSKAPFKTLAAAAAAVMVFAAPVAQATCQQDCEAIARAEGELARQSVMNAASQCGGSQTPCYAAHVSYSQQANTAAYNYSLQNCMAQRCGG